MIQSKYKNPLPNFVGHGVKTAGNYSYFLLIDMTGQALIQRIKSDSSEILFYKKPVDTSIADFWADPSAYDDSYAYLFEN